MFKNFPKVIILLLEVYKSQRAGSNNLSYSSHKNNRKKVKKFNSVVLDHVLFYSGVQFSLRFPNEWGDPIL